MATPRFGDAGVADFDPADYPLHRVRVGTWGCLVFVCLDPTTMPLADWIGDLDARCAGYRLSEWRTVERSRHRDRGQLEAHLGELPGVYYHLTWVHPELAKVSRVEDHYRFQGSGDVLRSDDIAGVE